MGDPGQDTAFDRVLRQIYRAVPLQQQEVDEWSARATTAAGGALSEDQEARLFAALAPAYAHNRGYAETRRELLERIRGSLEYEQAHDVVPELRLALAHQSMRYGHIRQANYDLNSVLLGVRGKTRQEIRMLALQRAALLALVNDETGHAWRLVGVREQLGSLDLALTRASSLLLRALVAAARGDEEAMATALEIFALEINPSTDPYLLRRYWLMRALGAIVQREMNSVDAYIDSALAVPTALRKDDEGWILMLRAASRLNAGAPDEEILNFLDLARETFSEAGRPYYQIYALSLYYRNIYLKRNADLPKALLQALAQYAVLENDSKAAASAFSAKGTLHDMAGEYEEAATAFRHAQRKLMRDSFHMDRLQSDWISLEGALDSIELTDQPFNVYLLTLILLLLALLLVLVLRIRTQRHVNVRLEASVQAAQEAEQAAQHANRLRSEFLSNVSHEIKTPMSGLVGMASILDELISDPMQRKYLDTIRICSRNLLVLLNDLLDLGRLETSEFKLDKVSLNVREVIEHSMQLLWPVAEDKGLDLELQADPELPRHIVGDPTRLNQILVNLLDNAVKFTEQGFVKLTVHYEATGEATGSLHLVVEDSGIGIEPERLRTVFEPFNQREPVYPHKGVGSGLGLAICQKLVTRMGGSISVKSSLNEGTRFDVVLPVNLPKESE